VSTSSNPTLAEPAVVRRILDRTRATYLKLKPHVALVEQALTAAPSPDLSLKSAKTVELLHSTFEEDQALADRMTGVLKEFAAAEETLNAAEAAHTSGTLSDDALQQLKRVAFFVSRFPEAMKSDALLTQLFPMPAVIQADAAE
jgi:hypothetical protein